MRRTSLPLAAALLAASVAACGDTDSASECTPAGRLQVQALDELKFDRNAYEAPAGCLGVTYVNDGVVPHTLLIERVSGFKLSVGDTDTGSVELDAGSYTMFCDVAGHRQAGMEAELVVT